MVTVSQTAPWVGLIALTVGDEVELVFLLQLQIAPNDKNRHRIEGDSFIVNKDTKITRSVV